MKKVVFAFGMLCLFLMTQSACSNPKKAFSIMAETSKAIDKACEDATAKFQQTVKKQIVHGLLKMRIL